MPTLLLRLVGPMQSWGTTSRFDQRDTGKEPSKSGVIGLLAAAMGIDRENWIDLEPLTHMSMGVRHDRPGVPKRDYQTAGCATTDTIIKADGKPAKGGGVVSQRDYLADAAFLVGLECDDRVLLERIYAALQNPVWTLALGRKSYVPSEPIWIENGLQDAPLHEVLARWPWISSTREWEKPPEQFLISFESDEGSGVLKMDQPLSSFAERRFGTRFVRSELIDFPQGTTYVSA
ncbi:MAG: type I-E CRISPR-associated protein Cas5/CasD [Nitrosomonas sp.]|uniref:type I-E CRISPR-associated protein Cas5/CasD n=1 Tax=Nitrosomonas sp. TaxID=42353 RepID=UPI0025EC0E75|nr:type I-E CRISPR-associated protein Cas5/CasD [Nitrosomonas sp.]UJP04043.1 MAG: type I-E CRISPR-associated protein Cas5/CasD [Nitrosomonas sp.]